jgi:predicted amidohydrolase
MSISFIASCLQTQPRPDFDSAIEEGLKLAEKSLNDDPSIICFPEYCGGLKSKNGRFIPPHTEEDDHPFLIKFKIFAQNNNVWISIGSIAISYNSEKYFNRSILLNNEGEITHRYDKIHLFDIDLGDDENKFLESETVNPGNQSSIAKTPFGIFGFSVCYDLRFAQLYRSMAKQGSEVLMVPSAFTKKTGEAHWHVLNRARAIENGAFVISACATGSIDGGGECYGHSLVIDPWGNVLADGGVGSRVVSAKINLADVKDTREKIPSLKHDRDFKLKIIDATKEI